MHFVGKEEYTGRAFADQDRGPIWDLLLPAHTAVCPAAPDQAATFPPAAGRSAPAVAAAAAAAFPASPQQSGCCQAVCWKTGAASCAHCFRNSQGTAISAILQINKFESYEIATPLAQKLERHTRILGLCKMKSIRHTISELPNQQNAAIKLDMMPIDLL